MLIDIVSKNGNLLLNIPVRGDGTIDDDEIAFLEGMGKWMDVNSEAISPPVRGSSLAKARRPRKKPRPASSARARMCAAALHRGGMRSHEGRAALRLRARVADGQDRARQIARHGSPHIAGLPAGGSAKEGRKVTGVTLLRLFPATDLDSEATGLQCNSGHAAQRTRHRA